MIKDIHTFVNKDDAKTFIKRCENVATGYMPNLWIEEIDTDNYTQRGIGQELDK